MSFYPQVFSQGQVDLVLYNDTGTFEVGGDGTLLTFEPSPKEDWTRWHPDQPSLWMLSIPEGVRRLPDGAFQGYQIQKLKLPDGLESLGERVFSRCDLGTVQFPRDGRLHHLAPTVFSGSFIERLLLPQDLDGELFRPLAHALRFTMSWDDLSASWPEEYAAIYQGCRADHKQWRWLYNDCGSFGIDSDGVLQAFLPESDNTAGERMLERLIIPEGVQAIPQGMFCRFTVLWEFCLPASLRAISRGGSDQEKQGGLLTGNTFAGCNLPDVTLPERLELMGTFAFGGARMRSLTVPPGLEKHLLRKNVRQLKGCRIQELRIPLFCEAAARERWGDRVSLMDDPRFGPLLQVKGPMDGESLLQQLL